METEKAPKSLGKSRCELCDYNARDISDLNKHFLTRKHARQANGNIMETEKSPKSLGICRCDLCNYSCNNTKDYKRHIATKKHILAQTDHYTFQCEICNMKYKTRNGLWKHSQHCVFETNQLPVTDKTDKDMIWELMSQQKEVQHFLMEQNKQLISYAKTAQSGSNNNNTTNSNNKFNMNFFLNEQCKNAVNMTDFLTNMKVDVSDLEQTGQLGYVDGISRIFLNHLKEMHIYERPVHCSDLKRETVYIKNENQWNIDKTKLNDAITSIAQKNMNQINSWIEKHPECRNPKSSESDKFVQLSHEACGGSSAQERTRLNEKIMKNILKVVSVIKQQ